MSRSRKACDGLETAFGDVDDAKLRDLLQCTDVPIAGVFC
jgi:hypothetical protein